MKFSQLKYVPIDDRVLVQPGPVKYVNAIYTVPVDDGINEGRTIDDVHEVTTEKQRVRTALRIGQILELSCNKLIDKEENLPFKVGDWVVYLERNAMKFDLLAKRDDDPKCPVMLRRYEILGLVNNVNDNDQNEQEE